MKTEAEANLKTIRSKIQEAIAAIAARQKEPPKGDRKSLEAFEKAIHLLTSELADWVVAERLQQLLIREEVNFKIREIFSRKKFLKHGMRTVAIRLSGGTIVPIVASYWIVRKNDKKEKRENGMYPTLLFFGIYDHCSPLLLAEISQLCVALGSMEEGQRLLQERGVRLDIKTIRNSVKRFARRARSGQKVLSHMIFADEKLKGRRVVISVDGGRLRIRKTKRGPKTKKGRSHYSTDWREPKLLIIYVVGEHGRIDKEFSPVIDGTLQGPEGLYALLWNYLQALGINELEEILFVADGAVWIWEQLQTFKALLRVKGIACKIVELLDMYHAVQHLYAFSELKRAWGKKKRARWINEQKRNLKGGSVDKLIGALESAARGAKSSSLRRELEYFRKNRERMTYTRRRAEQMPIGSGAIESAIRRVINLRLKSPCIFWLEDTASELLLLRAYFKARRWEQIKTMAYHGGFCDAA